MNMKKFIIFTLIILSFGLAHNVQAISGACSYHNGVNCGVGASSSGNAICNDGWESSTTFNQTDECNSSTKCPNYLPDDYYNSFKTLIENKISVIKNDAEQSCGDYFQRLENLNEQSYQSCLTYNQGMETSAMRSGRTATNLQNCEGTKQSKTSENTNTKVVCIGQRTEDIIYKYKTLLLCARPQSELNATKQQACSNALPRSKYSPTLDKCICDDGYSVDLIQKACTITPKPLPIVPTQNPEVDKNINNTANNATPFQAVVSATEDCKKALGLGATLNINTQKCVCLDGYQLSTTSASCVKKVVMPKANLNIRSKPTAGGKVLGVAKKDIQYEILDNTNKYWVKIKLNNKIFGWVLRTLTNIK